MKLIKYFNDSADSTLISQYAKQFNINSKVMEIIFSKGYRTYDDIADFLSSSKQPFIDPFKLSGMKQCVEKIKDAVEQNKRILVFGDYDVDGM